jgi:hypothetical protein
VQAMIDTCYVLSAEKAKENRIIKKEVDQKMKIEPIDFNNI